MSGVYLALAAPLIALILLVLWITLSHLRFATYPRAAGELPSLSPMGVLRYYWRLTLATLVVTWWAIRAIGRDGLRHPPGKTTGPPVLCVHGYFRNGTCMWGVRRHLERYGRPTRAVSMGRPYRPIEHYAPRLEEALRELASTFPGEKVDVLAHSMGGVVLRVVLARHPDLATVVGRIITLGSPHRGTAVVRGLALAPEHRQLELGSAFLESLPDFKSSVPNAEVTTVAAERDFIVYPKSTSHLPGTRAIDLANLNHQGLLTEAEVFELLSELVS